MKKQPILLKAAVLVAVWITAGALGAQTGASVPELNGFERQVQAVAARYQLPGYALAVTHGGKLVFARGFGWADRDKQAPVQPESLFRIGSVSKPLTAVTLLLLQEQGKLQLDDRVFDLLSEYQGSLGDARMRQITVRQLLHHIAGWDPRVSGDPLFPDHSDILSTGGSFPPTHDEVMRYWLKQPLDAAPGTAYHYSNFGFLLADRVIEKVTGKSYAQAVRELVLEPQGITRMRIGRSLEGQVAPNETRYYDIYSRSGTSIYAAQSRQVPLPYGSFSLDLVDSAGGWVASAPDLVRLLTAVGDIAAEHPSGECRFVSVHAGGALNVATPHDRAEKSRNTVEFCACP